MTDEEIIERYDSDWNMTVGRLADLSGRTVHYIKRLLLNEHNASRDRDDD